MISGFITVERKKYNFVIEEDTLKLLPKKEENNFIASIKYFQKAQNSLGSTIDRKIYEGSTTDNKLIYIVSDNNGVYQKGIINHKIYAYAIVSQPLENIRGIQITSNEFEYFYKVSKDIKNVECIWDGNQRGAIKFETKDFKDEVAINSFEIAIKKDVYRFIFSFLHYVQGNNIYPLKITPVLSLGFNNKKDMHKLVDIIYDIKSFIKFITYRNDVSFNEIKLRIITESNLYENVGTLTLIDNETPIEDKKILEDVIKFDDIKPILPELFKELMNDNVILNHIPITYKEKNKVDYYRYLAICTSFEAEYRRIYGDNYRYKTNKKFKSVRDTVVKKLSTYIKELSGDEKDYAKSFESINRKIDTSLQGALILAFNEHLIILKPFIKHYFSNIIRIEYNKKNLNKMCEEISKTRNYFAHANYNISYDEMSFLCLKLVEQLIYAMTLKRLGLDNKSIQRIINDLFKMRIALE